jgi:4-amino-4-deoxy-L-arabinose transferase-like glycosyltransferase
VAKQFFATQFRSLRLSPASSTSPPVRATPSHALLSRLSNDTSILILLALATFLVHLLTGNRYGFHRDELANLEDARHLAWGYVAYPPVTPFFGRISLLLFGTSLPGFRFFAWVVQAMAVFFTGRMARELGGNRTAQWIAALAAVPFCLGGGAIMSYISFDYLFWVLTSYFVLRLLNSNDKRWWLPIGAAVGLGMLSKYTMLFWALGLAGGLLLTDARRYFRSKWLWWGLALSLLIFFPNFLWLAHHHFASLDFLRFIHARDVREGLTRAFLPDQLEITLLAFPLALAGLYVVLISPKGRPYRLLGWMYLLTLLLFLIAKGRGYYLAPAYPLLYAAGAVSAQDWLASLRPRPAQFARAAIVFALLLAVAIAAAFALPLAPVNSSWWKFAIKVDGALREEIGWPELVENIARIRDSLPSADRTRIGILAGNYGELGALNLYGEAYGLPRAISGVNSSWERGYGDPPPETLIVLGFPRDFVQTHFSDCRLVGHMWNRYGADNEETLEHPDIFVCRAPLLGWPDFWNDFQYFALQAAHPPSAPSS